MEDITDVDYVHAKRVCKNCEIKHLEEYHDLYAQSDRFLLADVFDNFRNMCLEIYELDPKNFFSAHELAWQAALTLIWGGVILPLCWFSLNNSEMIKTVTLEFCSIQ